MWFAMDLQQSRQAAGLEPVREARGRHRAAAAAASAALNASANVSAQQPNLQGDLMPSSLLRCCGTICGLLPVAIGLSLTGCADQGPTAPTVMALPARGEGFSLFQQHDTTCRAYASAQTGGQSPGQAAAKSGVAGAALGTGLGAATGALLGSVSGHAGGGAAIGAGTGLLTGGLLGSATGSRAASSVQNRYNAAYAQCMVANGESIVPPPGVAYVPTPVFAVPPPPRIVYVTPPVYAVPPRAV